MGNFFNTEDISGTPSSLTLKALSMADGRTLNTLFIGGSGIDGLGTNATAGNNTSTGSNNQGIGSNSLQSLTSGFNNTMTGEFSGNLITSGSFNVSHGGGSLARLTTGSSNSCIGFNCMSNSVSSISCTAVGRAVLSNTNGSGNTGVGSSTLMLESNTPGNGFNVGIGYGAATYDDPITQSTTQAIITGVKNTFIGAFSLPSIGGGAISNAIAIGYKAQVGADNTAVIGNSAINVTIGQPLATARLHLPAGTATAASAPLKFTAGALLTALELGALEFTDDGTTGHLYITRNVAGVLTRTLIV